MLLRLREPDGLLVHQSTLLAERGIPHLVTTRLGAAGAELDANALDAPLAARLAALAGAPGARLVRLRQVHGAGVLDADELRAPRAQDAPLPGGDALVGGDPAQLLCVRSADCVPLLVASADGRRVAAIHAGWRGLLAGVIGAALARLGARPAVAWIGPCLSRARCEVGPEVAERFLSAGHAHALHDGPGGRPLLDLRAVARAQLESGGVRELELDPRCTWDDRELWSHRRDVTHGTRPRTATLASLIAARAGPTGDAALQAAIQRSSAAARSSGRTGLAT